MRVRCACDAGVRSMQQQVDGELEIEGDILGIEDEILVFTSLPSPVPSAQTTSQSSCPFWIELIADVRGGRRRMLALLIVSVICGLAFAVPWLIRDVAIPILERVSMISEQNRILTVYVILLLASCPMSDVLSGVIWVAILVLLIKGLLWPFLMVCSLLDYLDAMAGNYLLAMARYYNLDIIARNLVATTGNYLVAMAGSLVTMAGSLVAMTGNLVVKVGEMVARAGDGVVARVDAGLA
jgi:hypothetical protein